jgi:hypothetical protein
MAIASHSIAAKKSTRTKVKGSGRKKGSPNLVTREFRETISTMLRNNAENVEQWLRNVAQGDPENGIAPDPARALELIAKLAEYAAPKMTRLEVMPEGMHAGRMPNIRIEFVQAPNRLPLVSSVSAETAPPAESVELEAADHVARYAKRLN